jgi:hypothetical protein
VHVLLFDPGSDQEGIHSLELGGRTVVLLFENPDDAERYAGLLEAQDFPVPCVEALNRQDLEDFCAEAGYEARFVPAGFMPESEEERLLLAPPERNMEVTGWKEAPEPVSDPADPDLDAVSEGLGGTGGDPELEAFRRRLEGLL